MNYEVDTKAIGFRDFIDITLNTKHPRLRLFKNSLRGMGYCYVCGHRDGFTFANIINDDLANEWQLTGDLRKSFDIRESTRCTNCKSSLRSNLHARAIVSVLAPDSRYLQAAVKSPAAQKMKIAEINFCGALHPTLSELPRLQYSEYMPADKTVHHENLDKLTYQTNSFDIVLTSETLEHVPDWRQAKREIHRVLKAGGKHIFTVPAILTRQTRYRSIRGENGQERRLLPPSYHGCTRATKSEDYLVRCEFGGDSLRLIDELGFKTKLYYRNVLHLSDPNFVFVSTKV